MGLEYVLSCAMCGKQKTVAIDTSKVIPSAVDRPAKRSTYRHLLLETMCAMILRGPVPGSHPSAG